MLKPFHLMFTNDEDQTLSEFRIDVPPLLLDLHLSLTRTLQKSDS